MKFWREKNSLTRKVIILITAQIFFVSSISWAAPTSSDLILRRVKGALDSGSLPVVESISVSGAELYSYLESLGLPSETATTILDSDSPQIDLENVSVEFLERDSEGLPTKIRLVIDGGEIMIQKGLGQNWNISGIDEPNVPFTVVGETICMNKDGQVVRINPDSIVQIGDNGVASHEYEQSELPQISDSQGLADYLRRSMEPNGPTFGYDALKDVDTVQLVKDDQGNEHSMVLSYDEDAEVLRVIFYRGRSVYDEVKTIGDSGGSIEEAIERAIAVNGSNEIGRGEEQVNFKDKSNRAKWLMYSATALAAAGAVVATHAFFSVAPGGLMSAITSYFDAAITAMLFYWNYKSAALRTVKASVLPFANVKEVVNEFREDPNVLSNGLQKPLMICFPIYMSNMGGVAELRGSIIKTIENNITDVANARGGAGLMNGNLYLTITSSTANPEIQAAEIKLIKELTDKYGQWVKFSYLHRNPAQNDVGWKWMRLLFVMDLVTRGHTTPGESGAYVQKAFGRYQIPADQRCFLGDQATAQLLYEQGLINETQRDQYINEGFVTFNRGEWTAEDGSTDLSSYLGVPESGGQGRIQDFLFLDQGNNIAGPQKDLVTGQVNEHGELLRWAAKVSWSYANQLKTDENGNPILDADGNSVPVYDMFVPNVQWDPVEVKSSLFAQLQALDDSQNLGFLIADNWFMNYHSSHGKMWVNGPAHVERMLTAISEGEQLIEEGEALPSQDGNTALGAERPIARLATQLFNWMNSSPLLAPVASLIKPLVDRINNLEYTPELANMLAPNMTSHDRWESFGAKAARFLDIAVNEIRPNTVPEFVKQAIRFVYGDLTEYWQKYFPQSPVGQMTRKLLGLGEVSVPAPTTPDQQIEHRTAPFEYIFSDIRFDALLGWLTYMALKPGQMDLQHFWPALAMGISVGLYQNTILPKYIVPIITDLKLRVFPKLAEAFDQRKGEDILSAITAGITTGAQGVGETLWSLGKNTVLGTAGLIGDWFVYMPMMLIKPYLLGKVLVKNKFWDEFWQGKRTGWGKKADLALLKENFQLEMANWGKEKLDKVFSNLVVPAMGVGFAFLMHELVGPSWMWMAAPQFVTWSLWPFISNIGLNLTRPVEPQ